MTQPPIIRTRVAPSPTGDPHIGTAFIALFNMAFARRMGGRFILRIEDTDRVRSTAESERAIFEALRWLGIEWDEGPDVGGEHGPYRQSERTGIYREHCNRLLEAGHAFRCFCTAERLDAMRAEQQKNQQPLGYDGHCAGLGTDEAERRAAGGEAHVVRMKVPREGECRVHDRLRGEITIPWTQVDYQVLLKSDGFPTYHLANVVDDHLMGITHVIRGEEWINSAPKHLLLYEAFGWNAPEMIHLPLLRNPDKSKLSKRKNPTGIFYYRQAGYLPEAVLNYLSLMAYSMPDERELFLRDEFFEAFDIDRVSLGGPIFDVDKLTWLNGRHMRECLGADQILDRLKDWMLNDETLLKLLPMAAPRMDKLSDFVPMTAYLFADQLDYEAGALATKGVDAEGLAALLRVVAWELDALTTWTKDDINTRLKTVAEAEGVKLRELTGPLYVAMSGRAAALPLFDTMELLGRDMTRRRLQTALDRLDADGKALSGKALKKLEKDYKKRYGRG